MFQLFSLTFKSHFLEPQVNAWEKTYTIKAYGPIKLFFYNYKVNTKDFRKEK